MSRHRLNLNCNFRAPDTEWFQVWQEFKQATRKKGLDICFVVLALCRAWLKASNGVYSTCQIETSTQITFFCQTNAFQYNVHKPRRERFQKDCSKSLPKCTICSMAFRAYIMEKARELDIAFSFMDFPEINHDLFRKLILELRKSGKILALRPRTNPRFYILHEWKDRYPTMSENNRVKPTFTEDYESSEIQEGGF